MILLKASLTLVKYFGLVLCFSISYTIQAIRDLISSIIDSAYGLLYGLPFLASRNESLPIARQ